MPSNATVANNLLTTEEEYFDMDEGTDDDFQPVANASSDAHSQSPVELAALSPGKQNVFSNLGASQKSKNTKKPVKKETKSKLDSIPPDWKEKCKTDHNACLKIIKTMLEQHSEKKYFPGYTDNGNVKEEKKNFEALCKKDKDPSACVSKKMLNARAQRLAKHAEGGGNMSMSVKIGIIAGGVLLLIVIILLYCFCCAEPKSGKKGGARSSRKSRKSRSGVKSRSGSRKSKAKRSGMRSGIKSRKSKGGKSRTSKSRSRSKKAKSEALRGWQVA